MLHERGATACPGTRQTSIGRRTVSFMDETARRGVERPHQKDPPPTAVARLTDVVRHPKSHNKVVPGQQQANPQYGTDGEEVNTPKDVRLRVFRASAGGAKVASVRNVCHGRVVGRRTSGGPAMPGIEEDL